jgi:hypothetical protein
MISLPSLSLSLVFHGRRFVCRFKSKVYVFLLSQQQEEEEFMEMSWVVHVVEPPIFD